MRIPKHVGIIPDGNRRWAVENGLKKDQGYEKGLEAGLKSFLKCKDLNISEVTYYGFTKDNTKRPKVQTTAFTRACIDAVNLISAYDCEILVVGNKNSKVFPQELKDFTKRRVFGKGGIKVNFLVNYSWEWDLNILNKTNSKNVINSSEVSRIDLIIRFGGMRRLSGFLPVQSVYSDFYVLENLWPNYKDEDILNALDWYNKQDITLGG